VQLGRFFSPVADAIGSLDLEHVRCPARQVCIASVGTGTGIDPVIVKAFKLIGILHAQRIAVIEGREAERQISLVPGKLDAINEPGGEARIEFLVKYLDARQLDGRYGGCVADQCRINSIEGIQGTKIQDTRRGTESSGGEFAKPEPALVEEGSPTSAFRIHHREPAGRRGPDRTGCAFYKAEHYIGLQAIALCPMLERIGSLDITGHASSVRGYPEPAGRIHHEVPDVL